MYNLPRRDVFEKDNREDRGKLVFLAVIVIAFILVQVMR